MKKLPRWLWPSKQHEDSWVETIWLYVLPLVVAALCIAFIMGVAFWL